MTAPRANQVVGLADRAPAVEQAATVRPRRHRRPPALAAASLAVVTVTGLLALPMPFWGDQALFAVYGRQLSEGAVLYRDLFDVKQPGIFYFFALGGTLFGSTEVGIHFLELLYFLAFSAFVVVALRPYFATPWAAPAVPILTVAVYYLSAQVNDLTQIEILVAFPLLAAWWLIDRAGASPRGLRRYAAAGVLAAVVVLLKYVYLLIVLGFLGYTLVRARRRSTPGDARRALVAFSLGLVAPLLVVAAYFAAHGQLGRIWWAYVEYARGATSLVPRDLGFLVGSARRFLIGHSAILVLAAIGCLHAFRQRTRPRLDLAAGMVLWCGIGAVVFYVQLWGEYKWLLFTVPLGVLAVFGVEALAASVRDEAAPRRPAVAVAGVLGVVGFLLAARAPQAQTWLLWSVPLGIAAGTAVLLLADRPVLRRWMVPVVAAALAVSVGLMAVSPVDRVRALLEHDLAMTAEARNEFQRSWYPPYRSADEDLAALSDRHGTPASIYVLGHPVLLLRGDRPQVVPMLGWAYEVHDRRAWRELHRDLRSAAPDYIVVDDHAAPIVEDRYPALLRFVDAAYDVAFVGASGTWYVRRQDPPT